MQENKIFEALLDVIPFAAYAVDINTYEVVYANKLMSENTFAPREEFCWKRVHGQEEVCNWCTIPKLRERDTTFKNDKLINSFFDEVTDCWFQSYDELIKWPDGRTVKYSILVDITEQKEIQAHMIQNNTKLAIQSKKLQEANEKLEYMATKDFLTGINNRGHFFTLAKKLWDRKLLDGEEIYVCMIDIDHFKKINDTYGHDIGDKVLQSLSQTVRQSLRTTDVFARWGGEEFMILMPETSLENGKIKANSLKNTIDNSELSSMFDTPITISFGITQTQKDDTIKSLLKRVDVALYMAKEKGRNRIETL